MSGQTKAAAPSGAWNMAGIVRHRVTLCSAGHGLSDRGQLWLLYTIMYSTHFRIVNLRFRISDWGR